jgi:NADPH:quinone reductase-like Zn-dependent oxidoreductase
MKAIVVDATGALVWTDVAEPTVGSGAVLIEVAAAGVNRADLLQAAGLYPPPPGASEILGLEVSGIIAEIGPDVSNLSVGQRVCALLAGGGYAEKVAVPAAQVMPIPEHVELDDAAALPEVACTVWSNVVMTAQLRDGEWLLVHGGASGIGTHAIQIARRLGARVAVTAGSPAKLSLCRALGLDRNLAALAPDGRLVIIGMQGGVKGELNIAALIAKRLRVIGTALRGRPVDGPNGKGVIVSAVVDSVWPMIADRSVRPVIGARFPIEQAGQAHSVLAAGETYGKVLLTVRPAGS